MEQQPQPEPQATPEPTPQHGLLTEMEGSWDVRCEYLVDPENPLTAKATEKVETVGLFWTASRFKSRLGGEPYEGRATLGYDPRQGRWVSTWIGSNDPYLWSFVGDWDETEQALTMYGRGPSPHGPELVDYVTVERRLSSDERTFEMAIRLPDGGSFPLFRYAYKRRKPATRSKKS
jgi:hypothetical protein